MKTLTAGSPMAAGHFPTVTRTSVPSWSAGSTTPVPFVATEVAKLKELPGDELQVHGSGELARTLIEHDLIDEYRLVYFPVHLGQGKKLFRDGARAAALRLVSTSTTGAGVIIASYAPAGLLRRGSYALPSES
jgi:dihydrofolate reductase